MYPKTNASDLHKGSVYSWSKIDRVMALMIQTFILTFCWYLIAFSNENVFGKLMMTLTIHSKLLLAQGISQKELWEKKTQARQTQNTVYTSDLPNYDVNAIWQMWMHWKLNMLG